LNIAFTLCSNNYLAHAKTLGDSFLEYHPDFKFIIGLVDDYTEGFDYSIFQRFTIIPVKDINVQNLSELNNKYNITEFNTAVKPSYFHYLFKKYNATKVIYIDPDILITSRLEEVIDLLDTSNIIITPHICSPVDDEYKPTDFHTLRTGVFNLGFIALSNYPAVEEFLNWWNARVLKYGFARSSEGMFYDQYWINYVPAFYDNYFILKHLGYNVANWNLHERKLSLNEQGSFTVNNIYPLRFFHFSSYHYDKPDIICKYQDRYDFNTRPDLKALFNIYNNLLRKNHVEEIVSLPVSFYPNLNKPQKTKPLSIRMASRISRSLKVLIQ